MKSRGIGVLAILVALIASGGRLRLSAQSSGGTEYPYALKPAEEMAWIGGELALYGASLYLDRTKDSGDPSSLEASEVPVFDRLYTTSHSAALGAAADCLVVGLAAAAPAAALPGMDRSQALSTGLMLAETLGLAYSLDSAIKSVVTRYRPYAYSSPPPADIGSQDIASSFPSRHATLAFAAAAFAGSVFDSTHPDSRYRGLVWGGGMGLAAAIGALRVASGDHFLSDVAAGAALGSLVGLCVPYLHRAGASSGGSGTDKAAASLCASATGLIVTLRY